LDAAATDVLFKVARMRSLLPTDVRDPVMIKSDANASPVLYLALNSSNRTETDLADYARRYLENPLGNLSGVSKVEILGGGQFVMRIWLDPQKLAAHSLNALDVYSEIRKQNIERPGGSIVGGERQFNVSTTARIRSPEEFSQLIVGNKNGKFVRLEDVGHAVVGTQDETTSFMFNGKKAVALIIYKKSEGSPIAVADLIKKELPKVPERLPNDMTIKVAYDSTTFIEVAIKEVYETIVIAIILVLLVVFGFIGSLRASVIPMVTIPISLIGTCILIYLWGFSINILTLLAMVLAVGLVVDDAIVVLENIYRYIEEGMSPMKAALKGSKEIGFAVVAMTITLAAVYAPLSLAQGVTGQLFREFALTLAGSVIISGFVALTLSPMMCSRLLKPHNEDAGLIKLPFLKKIMGGIAKGLKALDEEYSTLLKFALHHRLIVVIVGVAFTGLSWGLMTNFLPSKFVPEEDRGIIRGKGDATKGLTLDALDRYVLQLDSIMDNNPAIENRLLMVKMPEVTVISSLKPWAERKKSSHEILKEINPELKKVVGLGITLSNQRCNHPLGHRHLHTPNSNCSKD
jgi:multidrug efflux pump